MIKVLSKLAFLWLCFLFTECSRPTEVAGGTHTGNGTGVSGIITNQNGVGRKGIEVQLYPQDYNVITGETLPGAYTTATDGEGG